MISSFLGGGSEILISSVFEAGPPPPTIAPQPTANKNNGTRNLESMDAPPQASVVTKSTSQNNQTSTDTAQVKNGNNGDGSNRQPDVFDVRPNGYRGLGSPLAKIFGRGSAASYPIPEPPIIDIAGNRQTKGSGEKDKETELELIKVKEELREVRESQLRMEEMLSQVLAGK